MIIDLHTHQFDVCPTCRGLVLVIRVKEEEIVPDLIYKFEQMNNRMQIQECLDYCYLNNIKLSAKEKVNAA